MATEQETFQEYRQAYLAYSRGEIEASELPDRNDPISRAARRSAAEELMADEFGEDIALDYYEKFGRINPETGALERPDGNGGFERGNIQLDGNNDGRLTDLDGEFRNRRSVIDNSDQRENYFNSLRGAYAVFDTMEGFGDRQPSYETPDLDQVTGRVISDFNSRSGVGDITVDNLEAIGGVRHVFGDITETIGRGAPRGYDGFEGPEPAPTATIDNFEPLVAASQAYFRAQSEYVAIRDDLSRADKSLVIDELTTVMRDLRDNNYGFDNVPAFNPDGYADPTAAEAVYNRYIDVMRQEATLIEAAEAAGLSRSEANTLANNLLNAGHEASPATEITTDALVEALNAARSELGTNNTAVITSILNADDPAASVDAADVVRRQAQVLAGDDNRLIEAINSGSHPRGLGIGAQYVIGEDNVQRIQQTLFNAGFYADGADQASEVDGQYGQRTKAAIEALQTQYGITVDGFIGPETLAALQVEEASQALGDGQGLSADQKTALLAELRDIQSLGSNIPAEVRDEVAGLLQGIEGADLGDQADVAAPIIADIRENNPDLSR